MSDQEPSQERLSMSAQGLSHFIDELEAGAVPDVLLTDFELAMSRVLTQRVQSDEEDVISPLHYIMQTDTLISDCLEEGQTFPVPDELTHQQPDDYMRFRNVTANQLAAGAFGIDFAKAVIATRESIDKYRR